MDPRLPTQQSPELTPIPILTVLYGRSGLGKTSLLQAGLFPALRERHLLPSYIRFDLKPGAAPLTQQLHHAVRDSIRADVPDPMLPSDDESLWEYLHRMNFELWSARNYPLTPVIVLDQFEELFTLGERVPDLVDTFRNELGDLVENRIPADLATRIDNDEAVASRFNLRSHNYKLLISLREDFLPDLEGWCRLIPSLARSRVRLLHLSVNEAFDAVHEPAAGSVAAARLFCTECEARHADFSVRQVDARTRGQGVIDTPGSRETIRAPGVNVAGRSALAGFPNGNRNLPEARPRLFAFTSERIPGMA